MTPQELRNRIAKQCGFPEKKYRHEPGHCQGCGITLVDWQAQYCFDCGEFLEESIAKQDEEIGRDEKFESPRWDKEGDYDL